VSPEGEIGGHWRAPPGVLIAAGPSIAAGAALDPGPTLVDVAPTILGLFGLPRSREMAGRPLVEMLDAGARERVPTIAIASYGAPADPHASLAARDLPREEDAETMKKLRALGYVD
jgi:hypothetical protein